MSDRESHAALAIGFLVALALHLALIPVAAISLRTQAADGGPDAAAADAVFVDPASPAPDAEPPPEPDSPARPKPEVRFGRDDALEVLTAAWIPYDAFEKLAAAAHRVDQPALQKEAPAVSDAPPRLDTADPSLAQPALAPPADPADAERVATAAATATAPPAPAPPPPPDMPGQPQLERAGAEPEPAPAAPVADAGDAEPIAASTPPASEGTTEPAEPAIEQRSAPPVLAAAAEQPAVAVGTATDRSGHDPRQAEAAPAGSADPTPVPAPAPEPPAPVAADAGAIAEHDTPRALPAGSPGAPETIVLGRPANPADPLDRQTQAAASAADGGPTGAPQSDRESSPSVRIDAGRFQPGGVLVGRGIELQTVAPRFGIATRLTAAPNNPKVLLAFDRSGQVVRATVLKSSGYHGVDGPILASLYKWRARGALLAQVQGEVEVSVELILR